MALSLKNEMNFLFTLITIGAIIGMADAKPPRRISGASDAESGAFKWIVSIGIRYGSFHPRHICGGAIISSRHILTAGHCVYNKNLKTLNVRGGITHLRDNNAVVANVDKIILHPEYVAYEEEDENDIAILVLDRDLEIGSRLSKVSIPNSMPVNHQHASVAGWGSISEDPIQVKTLTLKTANVEFLDDEACQKWILPVGPQFFCGLQEYGNILNGDSGSPLVSGGTVIGVVSSGYGDIHVPDFYTNVYHYRDWINAIIAAPSTKR